MKEDKKAVFISISSGFIGRNILSVPNAFFDHVKKTFDQVVLLVPEGTVDFYRAQYGDSNIVVEPVCENILKDEINTWYKKVIRFFYTFLLWNTGVKRLAWEGSYNESAPKTSWLGRRAYGVKWFIAHTFGCSRFVRVHVVTWLVGKFYKTEHYADYFKKYNPSVVFAPNIERWSDICLVREARKRGVSSVGMPGSWDHFPKKFRPVRADVLLVSTYTQRQEAIEYQSYKPSSVHVVGTPYYDAFAQKKEYVLDRKTFCHNLGLNSEKKIIFFSSEAVYSPDDGDVASMILQAINDGGIQEPAELIIRPYPGVPSEHGKFDHLDGKPGVFVDWVDAVMSNRVASDRWYPNFEQIIHFMNCLEHADVVVNSYSSIALEAAYFNKQAIWVNFDGRKERPMDTSVRRLAQIVHLNHLIETKGVYMANSEKELLQRINEVLGGVTNPFLEVLRHKMCGPLDGRTGSRIVNFLEQAAAVNEPDD